MKTPSRYTLFMPWFICSLGALFYSYEYLLRIAPSVMMPNLATFFHIHQEALGNLDAFYYYIYAPLQLVVGILMDRYGPRRLLTLACLCCVGGSFLFAATDLLWVAKIGRFLIGFGSAFAFVGVLKLATIWLPDRYFALFSGLATALGMIGAIIGNLFLTELVKWVGWQETIFLAGSFGILVALLLGIFVRDAQLERKKEQAPSSINLSAAIQNMKAILLTKQMWIVGLIGCFLYLSTSAFSETWGNQYLQAAHGFTANQSATSISLIFAGWVVGGPLAGWISDTIRRRNLPLTFNAMIAAVLITAVLFVPGLSRFDVNLLLFLFGVFSGAQVIVFAIGKELNIPAAAASAIAFTNMVVMLSGVIFQPLIGKILDLSWSGKIVDGQQLLSIHDYQMALLCMPIALIASALLSHFFLKETYCRKGTKLAMAESILPRGGVIE